MNVFIIAAITADGFIGRDSAHYSVGWTSREDSKMYARKTKESGVMVMGSRTFATMGRALPGRKSVVYTSQPETLAGLENVEATSESPADLLRRLADEGYSSVAICGGSSIYRQFLSSGHVDEVYLTVEPVFFGKGLSLFDEAVDATLHLVETKQLSQDTVQLRYTVSQVKA